MNSIPVPESHLDLLTRPLTAVLTTLMPDGQPQSTLVWCIYDGECASVDFSRSSQKALNLKRDPRLTLFVVDTEHTSRYIEIRGMAELTEEGAAQHRNRVHLKYTGIPHDNGDENRPGMTENDRRVICRIRALRINKDANMR